MFKVALIRIIYTAIMFLAGLVLSNLALPEKFGIISLLVLNASLLSVVIGFGADSIVLFKVSNKLWNHSQAFQFIWRTIFLEIGIFSLLEFGSWFLFKKTLLSNESFNYIIIDYAYFTGLVLVEKYLSLFYAFNYTKRVNLILVSIASLYLFALCIFYYLVQIDFSYILYLFAFQSLLQGIALVTFFKTSDNRKTRFENSEFYGTLKLSLIVAITNLIQLFAYRIDFWLIDYFYNSYQVGIYAQANKFANLLWVTPNILSQLLIPRYAQMQKKDIEHIFSSMFYLNFIVLVATIVCTNLFYRFYLKQEYRPGLNAFYLMLPGYFFWAAVTYFGAFIAASGKFLYNLIGSTLCFLIILFADLFLVPIYGINGASLANSICYVSLFFVYVYILKRKFSFDLHQLLWPHRRSFFNIVKLIKE